MKIWVVWVSSGKSPHYFHILLPSQVPRNCRVPYSKKIWMGGGRREFYASSSSLPIKIRSNINNKAIRRRGASPPQPPCLNIQQRFSRLLWSPLVNLLIRRCFLHFSRFHLVGGGRGKKLKFVLFFSFLFLFSQEGSLCSIVGQGRKSWKGKGKKMLYCRSDEKHLLPFFSFSSRVSRIWQRSVRPRKELFFRRKCKTVSLKKIP